jgi:hypothetical protein
MKIARTKRNSLGSVLLVYIQMATPDKEVASRIVELLRKKGLLSEGALGKVEAGLSAGTLSSEDWKQIIEREISGKKGPTAIEDK